MGMLSSRDKSRPCLIYQYVNMALRLSGQTSVFGGVFYVSNSLGNCAIIET